MALRDSRLLLILPETTKRCQPLKALKIELSEENKHLFNKSLSRRQRALSGRGGGMHEEASNQTPALSFDRDALAEYSRNAPERSNIIRPGRAKLD